MKSSTRRMREGVRRYITVVAATKSAERQGAARRSFADSGVSHFLAVSPRLCPNTTPSCIASVMRASHEVVALLRQTSRVTERSVCRACQRRWAQVHDIRFLLTRQKSSSVLDRYQSKLEQKAREEGKRNVEELRDAYKEKIEHLRQKAIVPGANAPFQTATEPPQVPYQAPPPPTSQLQQESNEASPSSSSASTSARASASSRSGVRTLDSFIDVEKVATLPQEEIETLWRLRHVRDAQSLCAVMKTETFDRIASTARKHPQFILPIPRAGQGAEIHFMQWTFPSPTTVTVLFTHLAEFKLRGEFAQPHTTVTHHLDMSGGNGLVLMEGRVMEDRGVSVDEAKWLLMCLQKFYGFEAHSESAKESYNRRQRLMEQFSGGDEAFRIEDLLEEAEKVP